MSTRTRNMPVRREGIRLRDGETRSLLIDPDRDVTHVLNPSARAIWELCDGTTTIDELVGAICQVFSVTHSEALRDVAAVLADLEAAGLVEWSPDDGRGR